MDLTRPDPGRRLRLRTLALLALTLSLVSLLGTWTWGRLQPALPEADLLPRDRASVIVRRTEVAFADAQSVWRRQFPDGSGHGYDPAKLTFFTRSTGTPCAGGAGVSGPFYCAETGTAASDLMFLDALGDRLKREKDLGLALVAARLSAEHLQREAGVLDRAALELVGARRARRGAVQAALALQADCLTGAWAASAASRLGPVPDGFYGQLVWSARNVVSDLAGSGVRVRPEFDAFAPGAQDDRAAAFAQGYAAAGPSGCPVPPELASGD
jgi:predicted metalloprotease